MTWRSTCRATFLWLRNYDITLRSHWLATFGQHVLLEAIAKQQQCHCCVAWQASENGWLERTTDLKREDAFHVIIRTYSKLYALTLFNGLVRIEKGIPDTGTPAVDWAQSTIK